MLESQLTQSQHAVSVSSPSETLTFPERHVYQDDQCIVSPQYASDPHEQSVHAAADEVDYLSLTAMSGPDASGHSFKSDPCSTAFTRQIIELSGANPGASLPRDQLRGNIHGTSTSNGMRSVFDLSRLDCTSFLRICCRLSAADWPLLSLSTCLEALKTVSRVDHSSSAIVAPQASPQETILAFVPVTIGILLSRQHHNLRTTVTALVERIEDANIALSKSGSDLSVVQGLMFQALLSLYHANASSTWHLTGLATTKAISMGLHHTPNATDDKALSEARESLFWCIYILDRSMAFSMDRPFGLEDYDMTLQLPTHSENPDTCSTAASSKKLHIWTVHYVHMLSQWRLDGSTDLDVCFTSYQHWHATYKELAEHMLCENSSSTDGEGLTAYLRKQESQLVCKALVQLVGSFMGRSCSAQLFQDVRYAVSYNVPQLISRLKTYTVDREMSLTFLDAYDLFAAILAYLYFLRFAEHPSSISQPVWTPMRPGISDMRLLMTSIDILQTVAERFPVIGDLKEVLWAFLAALDNDRHVRNGSTDDPMQKLDDEITNCALPIPSHWKTLIYSCLR